LFAYERANANASANAILCKVKGEVSKYGLFAFTDPDLTGISVNKKRGVGNNGRRFKLILKGYEAYPNSLKQAHATALVVSLCFHIAGEQETIRVCSLTLVTSR
jgi:hypothetical protein